MICKFCGNLIEDNSDYCFICGQKVEAAAQAAETVDGFNQPAQVAAAPVEAAGTAPAPAPAYVEPAPAYAQAPAYAPAPVAPVKEKKSKDPSVAGKAKKFFAAFFAATFVFQFISWLWVKKATKQGYEQKAADLTNSTMIGLCVFMGIVSLVLIFKYMLG